MVKMDKHRIRKWKCLYCGDRHKKITILTKDNIRVGYATSCCNCGHMDIYATNSIGITSICEGTCKSTDIKCAHNKGCDDIKCKYNPLKHSHIENSNRGIKNTIYNGKLEEVDEPKYR